MIGRKIRRSGHVVTRGRLLNLLRGVDGAHRRPWAVGLVVCLVVLAGVGGHAKADDCPSPLIHMPVIVEDGPAGLIRRRPVEMTPTRLVHADYVRSGSASNRVIDIGTGLLENVSSVRRRLRYHHEFPLDRHPKLLLGEIGFHSTRPASFDLRIGCDPLDPDWPYHMVEGDGDRLVLRIEAVLEPGERVILWWSVDLDIVVAGRLPHDRDGDGDLDLEDLAVALSELGRGEPEDEVQALRSLLLQLGLGGSPGDGS